jgi:DNA-binding XRE family transcriptional regulator
MNDLTIQAYRKNANLSQEKFSKLLNTNRTTASFYETKRQYPDLKTAEKMASLLNVTIGMLYTDYELELILRKGQ